LEFTGLAGPDDVHDIHLHLYEMLDTSVMEGAFHLKTSVKTAVNIGSLKSSFAICHFVTREVGWVSFYFVLSFMLFCIDFI